MDNLKEIISNNFKFKGEIHYEFKNDITGEITDSGMDTNLWVDQGITNIVNKCDTQYIILSSSNKKPKYNERTIPKIIRFAGVSRGYDASIKRYKFTSSYSPPTADYTISTIGISGSTDGSRAYCFTNLTEPIIHRSTDTLYVYYYVYVISYSGKGFGSYINDKFVEAIFGGGWEKVVGTSLHLIAGNIGEIEADDYAYNLTYGSYTQSTDLGATENYNSRKFKKWMISGNLGSPTDLGSWISTRWTGLKLYKLGAISKFKGIHIGRIWAKSKTCTAAWFSSLPEDMPSGFFKAIQIRVPEGLTDLKRQYSYNTFLVKNSGGLGVGSYYINCGDSSYFTYEYLPTSFNSSRGLDFFPAKLGGRGAYIFHSGNNKGVIISADTLASIGIGGNTVEHPIYDDCFSRNLFTLRDRDVDSVMYYNSIRKYTFDNDNHNSGHTSITFDTPYNCNFARTIDINFQPFIFLSHRSVCKTSLLDPVLNTFSDFFINSSRVWLLDFAINSFAYDEESKNIIVNAERELSIFNSEENEINTFSGIADLSGADNRQWNIMHSRNNNSSYFEFINNELNISTAIDSNSTRELNAGEVGIQVNEGPFEATCRVEFNPFEKNSLAGIMAHGIDLTNANKLNAKRISLSNNIDVFSISSFFIPALDINTMIDTTDLPSNITLSGNLPFYLEGIAPNKVLHIGPMSGGNYWNFYLDIKTNYDMATTFSIDVRRGYSSLYIEDRIQINGGEVNYDRSTNTAWRTLTGQVPPGESTIRLWIRTAESSSSNFYYEVKNIYVNDLSIDVSTLIPTSIGVTGKNIITDIATTATFLDQPLDTSEIRFKIVRDELDVIKTYFSNDPPTVIDSLAVWTEYNNEVDYVYSGPMGIAMFSELNGGIFIKTAKFKDFRINSGSLEKRYYSVSKNTNKLSISNMNSPAVYDGDKSYKFGTVLFHDNVMSVISQNSITIYNKVTLEILKIKKLSDNYITAYFHSNEYASHLILYSNRNKTYPYNGHDGSNHEQQAYNNTISCIYTYEPLISDWVKTSADGINGITLHEAISYNKELLYLDKDSGLRVGINCLFDWNTNLNKWILVDWDKAEEDMVSKPAHSNWEFIHSILPLENRIVPDPIMPDQTFSLSDKYTFIANQDGFSKDNMQYLGPFNKFLYLTESGQQLDEFIATDMKETIIPASLNFDPSTLTTIDDLYNMEGWEVTEYDYGWWDKELIDNSDNTKKLSFKKETISEKKEARTLIQSKFALEGDFDVILDIKDISSPHVPNFGGAYQFYIYGDSENTIEFTYRDRYWSPNYEFVYSYVLKDSISFADTDNNSDWPKIVAAARYSTAKLRITRVLNITTLMYSWDDGLSWITHRTFIDWYSGPVVLANSILFYDTTGSYGTWSPSIRKHEVLIGTAVPIKYYECSKKIENSTTFFSLDFDQEQLYEGYFKNLDNSYAYFKPLVEGIEVTEVISQSEFKISSNLLSINYNYYKGAFIKVGEEYIEILEFDNVSKQITLIAPIINTILISDIISICTPDSVKISKNNPVQLAAEDKANHIAVSERQGTFIISPIDENKKLVIQYTYLIRSW